MPKEVSWNALGLSKMRNDVRAQQTDGLEHVLLVAHGWPKQDMRDAQALHILQVMHAVFWTAHDQ